MSVVYCRDPFGSGNSVGCPALAVMSVLCGYRLAIIGQCCCVLWPSAHHPPTGMYGNFRLMTYHGHYGCPNVHLMIGNDD